MFNTAISDIHLGGFACRLYASQKGAPVFLLGSGTHERDNDALISLDLPFSLFVYEAPDWDAAFSPWEADLSGRHFAGKAAETLSFLTKEALPFIREQLPCVSEFFPIGYSLAGLFSLWAAYESDVFAGAASCSGSLWYPGWEEFARENQVKAPDSRIYLSLGGKEKNSPDPVMATIENKTKLQAKILQLDKHVVRSTMEMNSGGHFADAGKRLAKAIRWLLQ